MQFTEEHICIENKFHSSGIRIFYGFVEPYDEPWNSWILYVSHITTQEEVNLGEAKNIGDIDKVSSFIISYCPFCGKKLKNE